MPRHKGPQLRRVQNAATKTQRACIDTSVLGGCFDPEFARWSNALLADFRASLLSSTGF